MRTCCCIVWEEENCSGWAKGKFCRHDVMPCRNQPRDDKRNSQPAGQAAEGDCDDSPGSLRSRGHGLQSREAGCPEVRSYHDIHGIAKLLRQYQDNSMFQFPPATEAPRDAPSGCILSPRSPHRQRRNVNKLATIREKAEKSPVIQFKQDVQTAA